MSKPEVGKVAGNKPAASHLVHKDAVRAFKFLAAPKGKTNVFISIGEDKPLEVELNDGIIEPSGKNKDKLIAALELLPDFEDVTYVPVVSKPKKFRYSLIHPEHTEDNKIEGEFKIGRKKFEMIEGIIVTEDEKVRDALIKEGFTENKEPEEV